MAEPKNRPAPDNRHRLVGRRVPRDKWGEPIGPFAARAAAISSEPGSLGRLFRRLAQRLRRLIGAGY